DEGPGPVQLYTQDPAESVGDIGVDDHEQLVVGDGYRGNLLGNRPQQPVVDGRVDRQRVDHPRCHAVEFEALRGRPERRPEACRVVDPCRHDFECGGWKHVRIEELVTPLAWTLCWPAPRTVARMPCTGC